MITDALQIHITFQVQLTMYRSITGSPHKSYNKDLNIKPFSEMFIGKSNHVGLLVLLTGIK